MRGQMPPEGVLTRATDGNAMHAAGLDRGLAELPESLRTLLVAHFVEGEPVTAIGRRHGIPATAVTAWIALACAALECVHLPSATSALHEGTSQLPMGADAPSCTWRDR